MPAEAKVKKPDTTGLDVIARLNRDLKVAALKLSDDEARFLVDSYYTMQEDRIRADHQRRSLEETNQPHSVLEWLFNQSETLEKQIARALDSYSDASAIGLWAKSICGIGPVITAGLLSHIDIHQAPTVGHIWRFAGLDPTMQWLGKERSKSLVASYKGRKFADLVVAICADTSRKPEKYEAWCERVELKQNLDSFTKWLSLMPWDNQLKRLCFLIGECFVKVSSNDKDVYGAIWRARKDYEERKNLNGDYADQAAKSLAEKNYNKDTDAYKAYIKGQLPQARIHLRAKRYAVKLFLAHYHHVAHETILGSPPPKPYVLEHMGHVHYMAPPNWPMTAT
jgi:hypothetical protein